MRPVSSRHSTSAARGFAAGPKRSSVRARVTAARFVYATGSYDQNLPIEDNDRPGVLSARAVGRLAASSCR